MDVVQPIRQFEKQSFLINNQQIIREALYESSKTL